MLKTQAVSTPPSKKLAWFQRVIENLVMMKVSLRLVSSQTKAHQRRLSKLAAHWEEALLSGYDFLLVWKNIVITSTRLITGKSLSLLVLYDSIHNKIQLCYWVIFLFLNINFRLQLQTFFLLQLHLHPWNIFLNLDMIIHLNVNTWMSLLYILSFLASFFSSSLSSSLSSRIGWVSIGFGIGWYGKIINWLNIIPKEKVWCSSMLIYKLYYKPFDFTSFFTFSGNVSVKEDKKKSVTNKRNLEQLIWNRMKLFLTNDLKAKLASAEQCFAFHWWSN